MNSVINPNDDSCIGCGACAATCPVGCISIRESSNGEYRPIINDSKCCKCNLCSRVCYLENTPSKLKMGQAYYGWANNNHDRVTSSSGGIAAILARYFISIGGVVVGAGYLEDFTVSHILVDNENDLERIRGSKYVESRLDGVLKTIKDKLDKGLKLLFIGVPCQIYALKCYLKKEYSSLYLVEIFCHGAPRIGIYKKYTSYLTKKYGDIKSFNFRSKYYGWKTASYFIEFPKKRLHQKHSDNIYHLMFGYHNSLRASCFNCKCRSELRVADISLGDFWGIDLFYKNVDLQKGCSAIFINSPKGQGLISTIQDDISIFECKKEEILTKNAWFVKNYTIPTDQSSFNRDFQKLSINAFFRKYWIKYKVWNKIKAKLERNH